MTVKCVANTDRGRDDQVETQTDRRTDRQTNRQTDSLIIYKSECDEELIQ